MKISQKLIILFLLMALIPIIVIGVFSYINSQRALNQEISTQLTNTLTRQTAKISQLAYNDSTQVGLFAANGEVRLLTGAYDASPTPAAVKQLSAQLLDMRNNDRSIRRAHVVSLKGTVVASSDPRLIGHDFKDTTMFKKGLEGTDVSVFFKDIDGVEGQYLTTPVTLDNQVVGVLILEHQSDSYSFVTSDYVDGGNTGETFMLGADPTGQKINLQPLRFDAQGALKPYKENGSGSQTRDYRGHLVLQKTTEVPATHWTVGVKIDQDEVYGPITRLRNLTLEIIAVTTLLVIFVGWYFALLIVTPIRRFTEVVLKISGGDLSRRVQVKSRDEIGLLGSAFNNMTDKLSELYNALELKVKQRTLALNQKVEELGAAKAKDDAILASIGDGMIVTDNIARILLMNDAAATMLGIDRAKALGNPTFRMYTLFDDNDKELPVGERPLQRALAAGQKVTNAVKSHHSDGSSLTLSMTATPVVQNGVIIGAIQIIRDVTKEKEVDRMKTEFISLASHQLRTPLTAIRWFTEMLVSGDSGPLQPQQQEFAANIASSTDRMIALVSSLLNISRIESGRIIIDPKPTDLKELVTGIVNDLKAKIEERKQNLAISVHDNLPKVNLDPRLIGQVYLNFLTNAIKYTPPGGEISVFVSRKGEDIISQITDNGYGIPKEQQGRMFQKFFRATNAVKVESDGTGLGLYLIKAVIESSGGKIWFESEEGKGSTFWFSIPVAGMKAKAGEVTLDAVR